MIDKNLQNEEKEENTEKNGVFKEVLSIVIDVIVCFVVVFIITHFIGQRTIVNGSSMEDTFSDGDNLICDRISYRFSDPERFDVVVFPPENFDGKTYFIKRIIGLPGETVRIDNDGVIFINDEPLLEKYGTEQIYDSGLAASDITLGEDEYFVLGDNRNNSLDSRFEEVGNVKGSSMIGKAWVRVYPFNKAGFVNKLE